MTESALERHPGWYGAVMGTGALALALSEQFVMWGSCWLGWLADAALVLASVLAITLLPRYLRRLGNRPALFQELADPAGGPLLATLPAGLLVLAAGWGRVGPSIVPTCVAYGICAVLIVIGGLLAVALGTTWASAILQARPGLEGVNGGWLIPAVMNLLVPVALAPLIIAHPDAAAGLLIVGFAFYGMGIVLFLAMFTLLVARLVLHEPLAPALQPSLWLPLAPAGLMGLGMLRLLQAGQQAGAPGFDSITAGVIVSAIGIGFGLWWTVFATIELLRIRRVSPPPVSPGWWGFVFPVGALTVSIATLGSATDIVGIELLGAIATVLLAALWMMVLVRTTRQARAARSA